MERLPCRLTWVDARPEQFPAETGARVVIEDEPVFAVDDAPAGAFYLVMTHSHALDFEIVERALKRTDARFVGMIGSETKAAKLRSRLAARGVDASRLVSPIGSFKGGKHPVEVAVSAALAASGPAPQGASGHYSGGAMKWKSFAQGDSTLSSVESSTSDRVLPEAATCERSAFSGMFGSARSTAS